MNLNQATLIGRVVRDPELKALPSGSQVASFSMATSRTYKQDGAKKEQTEFHNIVAFGKLAEIIGNYVKKGQLVMIQGRIQTRSWEKDGKKNYRTEILAEDMQMGPKPAGSTAAKSTSTNEEADDAPAPEDIPF